MLLTTGPSLSKHARFGFALQSEEGVAEESAENVNWVPWNDTLDFARVGNVETYRQADYTDYDHLVFSSGQWFEGGVPVALQAVEASLDDLITWITDRSTMGYNQGRFATVFILDQYQSREILDVKVREAVITLVKRQVVSLTLDLVGKEPVTPYNGPEPDVVTGGPYIYQEATLSADVGGIGSLSVDYDFEEIEVRINNVLEDPGEGMRLDGSFYPRTLYNLGGPDVSGRFVRDIPEKQGSDFFTKWIASLADTFGTTYDGALRISLARGGVTLQLDMPRVRWMDPRSDLPGDNRSRIQVTSDWLALGSDDGATPPITLTIP